MCDLKKKTCQCVIFVRLFNMYFFIKSLMKSIKIYLKKESTKIYILVNFFKKIIKNLNKIPTNFIEFI